MSAILARFSARPDAREAGIRRMASAATYRGAVADLFCDDHVALGAQGNASLAISPDFALVACGWLHVLASGSAPAPVAQLLLRHQEIHGHIDPLALGGQFSAIVYDRRKRSITVVRDHGGGTPLHGGCSSSGERLWLASDIRQVGAGSEQPLVLDLAALRRLQIDLRLPLPATPYHGIQQAPPGRAITLRAPADWPDACRARPPRPLYDLIATRRPLAPEAMMDKASSYIERSLAAAMTSPGDAVSLSGGMDSNLLYLCALKSGRQVWGVSCTFPGLDCDESDIVSAHRPDGISLVELRAPDFDVWQEELFARSDHLPFPASQVGLNAAMRAADLGARHLITGNGGDELFDWHPASLARCWLGPKDLARMVLLLRDAPARTRVASLPRAALSPLGRKLAPARRRAIFGKEFYGAQHERWFYLASEQLVASAGVEERSPFRDLALTRALSPFMPLASFAGGRRRGLQAMLIERLSAGALRLDRSMKKNYDEFATVPAHGPDPQLGAIEAGREAFGGLVPAFVRFKTRREGLALK